MDTDEKKQLLKDFALKLISFRPRTVKELKGKMIQFSIKRSISEATVDEVIDDLVSKNYINDREFIRWWIGQRLSFRPKGKRVIVSELAGKGIDRNLIDEIFEEEREGKDLEFEGALKVATKKFKLYRNLSHMEIKMKLGRVLAARGFEWNIIYRVIDSLIEKS